MSLLLSLLCLPLMARSSIELKKIISKQALYNIRFVSEDSSFTIYQRHTGGLYLSTNYSVKKIISSEINSQFNVTGNKKFNNLIITKIDKFHQNFNPNKEHEIFFHPYNLKGAATFLGRGVSPKAHLNGDIISIYRPSKNEFILFKLSLPTKTYVISTDKSANPFFIPKLTLLDETSGILLQQNSSGIQYIETISLIQKEKKVIKKNTNYNDRLEFCTNEGNIYIFQSKYSKASEEISTIEKRKIKDLSMPEVIYTSPKADLGQIACNTKENEIFFLKNFSKSNKAYLDIASLNLITKKVTRLTNEDYITNIFEMDGRLIVVNNGVQMLLIGDHSLKKDAIPKRKKVKSKDKKK